MKRWCLFSLLLAWIIPGLSSAQDMERRASLGAEVLSLTPKESKAEGKFMKTEYLVRGRKILLNIVVLPALNKDHATDPVFWLTNGIFPPILPLEALWRRNISFDIHRSSRAIADRRNNDAWGK